MKKIFLVCLVLLSSLLLVWCGSKKEVSTEEAVNQWTTTWDMVDKTEETTTTSTTSQIKGKYSFGDENCDKYVKLMECLIDKTPDSAKSQTISSFEKVMELWKGLDKSVIAGTCKNTIDMLNNQKDVFEKAWCALN